MPESISTFTLDAGTKVSVSGERYEVTETMTVPGNLIPKPEEKQKTYMMKAKCPTCGRIIRLTGKNWEPNEVRLSIICMHQDQVGVNFVLDNE